MVALDHSAHFDTPSPWRPSFTLVFFTLLALLVFTTGFALRGFGDNGVRFGTQLVWRLGSLVFFAALVIGPLGRLPSLHLLADKSRAMLQGFCAVLGVYFASLLVPNLFAVSDGVRPAGITTGMTIFILFTGSVTLVLSAAASRSLCDRVGQKACRAMLGIAVAYFWLCYSLIGLAHISGPHRPDNYYEFSVILMLIGLLARFAAHFVSARRVPSQ
ncbi:MAG: hypothetical protein JO256_02715 [Alphaproteobacteria bacterium]|nr:hypothetical protein [Alphaproteobacteria bacterium]